MPLVPVGTRRVMVAQRYDSVPPDMNQNSLGLDHVSPDDALSALKNKHDNLNPQQAGLEDQINHSEQADEDTVKYVFNFLKSLGYPPRRLFEFKAQFVKEEGGADGVSQVTITIPDQIYGKDTRIPNSKLKEFVKGIEDKFPLYYQNYKRSDEKLIISFSSHDARADREQGPGDILDKVYGNPKNKTKSIATASTMREIIKESKNNLVNSVLKFGVKI